MGDVEGIGVRLLDVGGEASAISASASGAFAESAQGIAAGGSSSSLCGAVCSGASSRIRWALVPLMPKEETPALRGRSPRFHSLGSVSSSISPALQSTWGLGSST